MIDTFLDQLAMVEERAFLGALLVALPLLLIGWRPWRRAEEGLDSAGRWASALAVAGAYIAAYHGMEGKLPLVPPTSFKHWVALAVVVAVLLAPLGGGGWKRSSRGLAAWAVLSAGLLWLALAPMRKRWDGTEEAWWLGSLWLAGLCSYGITADLFEPTEGRRDRSGPGGMLGFAVATFFLAQVLGQSSGGSAQVLGAIAIVPALWLLIALLRPERAPARGAAGPWCAATFGLAVLGVLFAETPRLAAGIALFSPVLLKLPGGTGRRPALVRLALIAAAGAVALWLAWVEPDPYMDY